MSPDRQEGLVPRTFDSSKPIHTVRDIALHILRKLLVAIALIVACAAYGVAAFADVGSGTPSLRDGRASNGERQQAIQQPSPSTVQHTTTQKTPQVPPKAQSQTLTQLQSQVQPNGQPQVQPKSQPSAKPATPQQASTETLPLGKRPAPTTQSVVKGEKPVAPSSIGRTVLALGAVLALIAVLAFAAMVIRRKAQQSGKWPLLSALNFASAPSPSGVLEVLAKFPVGSGTSLLLLKLDRRVLLISQSANKGFRSGATLSTLCELTEPDDVASLLMKVRGEEQSRLAAKFESILALEEEITDQALSDADAEPVRALRTARHTPPHATNVKSRAPGATLAVPQDVTQAGSSSDASIVTTRTGREALAAIQARMGRAVPQPKAVAAARETSPRSRVAPATQASPAQREREAPREVSRNRSVLNANGSGGLLA